VPGRALEDGRVIVKLVDPDLRGAEAPELVAFEVVGARGVASLLCPDLGTETVPNVPDREETPIVPGCEVAGAGAGTKLVSAREGAPFAELVLVVAAPLMEKSNAE
jgi:hypothetical protein